MHIYDHFESKGAFKMFKLSKYLYISADKVEAKLRMDAKTLRGISYGAIGVVILVLIIFAVKEIASVNNFCDHFSDCHCRECENEHQKSVEITNQREENSNYHHRSKR